MTELSQISQILYDEILTSCPRDLIDIITSYLLFLPTKRIFSFEPTDEKECFLDVDVKSLAQCPDEKVIVFTDRSIIVYRKNGDIFATYTAEISDVAQYSDRVWICTAPKDNLLLVVNCDKFTDAKKATWFYYAEPASLNIIAKEIPNLESSLKITCGKILTYNRLVGVRIFIHSLSKDTAFTSEIDTILVDQPIRKIIEVTPETFAVLATASRNIQIYNTKGCKISELKLDVMPMHIGITKNNKIAAIGQDLKEFTTTFVDGERIVRGMPCPFGVQNDDETIVVYNDHVYTYKTSGTMILNHIIPLASGKNKERFIIADGSYIYDTIADRNYHFNPQRSSNTVYSIRYYSNYITITCDMGGNNPHRCGYIYAYVNV